MISYPVYLRVSPEKKLMALMLLSPDDVMDPIWEDYADGGERAELCVSPGKMWIEKLWEDLRGIWLRINLFLLMEEEEEVWLDTKLFHCKCSAPALVFPLTKSNSSSKAAGNKQKELV